MFVTKVILSLSSCLIVSYRGITTRQPISLFLSAWGSEPATSPSPPLAIKGRASLATYIAAKSVEPIVNIENLPFHGYFQEFYHWVIERLFPSMRSFPELGETLAANNAQEWLLALTTHLFAGFSTWKMLKKRKEKSAMNKEINEAVKSLG